MKDYGLAVGIILVVAIGFIIRAGCSPSNNSILDDFIALEIQNIPQAITDSRGLIEEIEIYKDDEGDGIIYECYLSEDSGVDIDQLTEERCRAGIKLALKVSPQYKFLKSLLDKGIYMVYRYNDYDDEFLLEVIIDKDDL
ncbi:MAG: hypothetical protein COA79_09325 [Planctomycetota bacterium]|nr:MAG: hypothetical protein COA79_09325 [Planctomycetota bacterium]